MVSLDVQLELSGGAGTCSACTLPTDSSDGALEGMVRGLRQGGVSLLGQPQPLTHEQWRSSFMRRNRDPQLNERVHRVRALQSTLKVSWGWGAMQRGQGPGLSDSGLLTWVLCSTLGSAVGSKGIPSLSRAPHAGTTSFQTPHCSICPGPGPRPTPWKVKAPYPLFPSQAKLQELQALEEVLGDPKLTSEKFRRWKERNQELYSESLGIQGVVPVSRPLPSDPQEHAHFCPLTPESTLQPPDF